VDSSLNKTPQHSVVPANVVQLAGTKWNRGKGVALLVQKGNSLMQQQPSLLIRVNLVQWANMWRLILVQLRATIVDLVIGRLQLGRFPEACVKHVQLVLGVVKWVPILPILASAAWLVNGLQQ
tara:strand:- start:18 stop:386 length:369 start_codon:yes stop_codon:yes gene_type:complete